MSVKSLIAVLALTALLVAGSAPRVMAQTTPYPYPGWTYQPSRQVRQVRPRIEVNPQRLLYRRCIDWYELQNRPSGTVLFPELRCWWVRG
jgi:hypothetical protein